MNLEQIHFVMDFARQENIPVLMVGGHIEERASMEKLYNVPTNTEKRLDIWEQIEMGTVLDKIIVLDLSMGKEILGSLANNLTHTLIEI